MGYRTFEHKPKPPRRTMQKTTTPHRVYLHNGTDADLAIPCFYQIAHEPIRMKPHNRPMHDHMGWPDPRRKDRSCQLYEPYEAGYPPEPKHTRMGGHPPVRKLLDVKRLIPIHLLSDYEGYTKAHVALVKADDGEIPEKVLAKASIDQTDDWIVHVQFKSYLINMTEPEKYRFAVYVDKAETSDLVGIGELIVLPTVFFEEL